MASEISERLLYAGFERLDVNYITAGRRLWVKSVDLTMSDQSPLSPR
jgi:hypothetical protein